MINKKTVEILLCPENHMALRQADRRLVDRLNSMAKAGQLKSRSGRPVERTMDEGLVREDRAVLYPVLDGIPILLVDEAIPLEPDWLP